MGLAPLDEARAAAGNRGNAAATAIIEARATSYERVVVKARVMRDDSDAGATDFTRDFLSLIIADFCR